MVRGLRMLFQMLRSGPTVPRSCALCFGPQRQGAGKMTTMLTPHRHRQRDQATSGGSVPTLCCIQQEKAYPSRLVV